MNGNNIVLHCQEGSSDKIYIWGIRKVGNIWEVIGKWGRRGKNVAEQKKGTYHQWSTAMRVAEEEAGKKKKRGYIDIRSSEYDGPLTKSSPEVAKYLEPETDIEDFTGPEEPEEPKKPVKKSRGIPKLKKDEMCVAQCIDNTGMEKFFDVGVDYIVEGAVGGTDANPQMVKVIDSNGDSKECYRDRFGDYKVE